MAITSDFVEAFLKCPTKCFLRARAEVATGNAYADWFRTKSEIFRSEVITRLVAGIAPDKCATSTAATECGRSAQWQLALDFTAGSENLRCSFGAVERIPSAGRGRAAPIRFVFSNKLTRHDKLLLAFDALVISEVFGGEATLGRIVHGDDHVTQKVKVPALKNEVEKLTDKIGAPHPENNFWSFTTANGLLLGFEDDLPCQPTAHNLTPTGTLLIACDHLFWASLFVA
jgi:hypothetical protein